MRTDFLERLTQGPLLVDGGYYLELERRCVGSMATDITRAAIEHPEGLLELHREFARAGAEVLQAMAWGVYPARNPSEDEEEIHKASVDLAREAAGPDRFVAGTLSAARYGLQTKWVPYSDEEKRTVRQYYDRRVDQQTSAGVDLFIVETFYGVDEAVLAIPVVKNAGLPTVVTLTFRDAEHTRDGYAPAEAAKRLVDSGADVVGVNCMRPWDAMSHLVRQMSDAVSVPICSQPTGYELEPHERFHRVLSRAPTLGMVEPRSVSRHAMAEYALEANNIGVDLMGSCCGSLPYHVRAMADALGKPVELPDVDRGYRPR